MRDNSQILENTIEEPSLFDVPGGDPMWVGLISYHMARKGYPKVEVSRRLYLFCWALVWD